MAVIPTKMGKTYVADCSGEAAPPQPFGMNLFLSLKI